LELSSRILLHANLQKKTKKKKSSELRNVLRLLLPLTWRGFCHKLTHKASFERLLCKIIVIEINIYLFLEYNFKKNKQILSLSHNIYLFLKFKIQNNF
jgi:hypothetical protein